MDLFGVFNNHRAQIQNVLDLDDQLKYWVKICCDLKIFDSSEKITLSQNRSDQHSSPLSARHAVEIQNKGAKLQTMTGNRNENIQVGLLDDEGTSTGAFGRKKSEAESPNQRLMPSIYQMQH